MRKGKNMVLTFEDSMVEGVISSTKAKPVTDFNASTFPSIKTAADGVEVAGDTLVTFRDTPAIRAFVKFLTTPEAAEAWAKLGGFATGNNKVPASTYPDSITRATAVPISKAKTVVFDMSDQQPSAFGGTVSRDTATLRPAMSSTGSSRRLCSTRSSLATRTTLSVRATP